MDFPIPPPAPADSPSTPRVNVAPLVATLWVILVIDAGFYLSPTGASLAVGEPNRLAWYGMQLGLACLAAIWCALGSERWLVRALVSAAVLAAVCATLDRLPVSVLAGSLFVTVGVPLAVWRFFSGLHLGWSGPEPGESRLPRRQFTLRDLQICTVAAALLFAGLLRVREMETYVKELCLYTGAFTIGPWAILPAVFARPPRRAPWVIAVLTGVAGVTAPPMVGPANFELIAVVGGTQFVVVTAVCLAARRSGLRWAAGS